MNLKEALLKGVRFIAAFILLIIPFIAGICTMEYSTNGFELGIGIATMVIVLGIVGYACYKYHKKGKGE